MKTKLIKGHPHILYEKQTFEPEEMKIRAREFYEFMNKRRTVRDFSDRPVPGEVIDYILRTASTAPSGANKQPWTFCVISDPKIKSSVREAAEREEKENYSGRMSDSWMEDLEHLGTDEIKPFLEIAPYLIIIFKRAYEVDKEGNKRNNYYVNESVGLAAGMLLTAIHNAGLVALTHTPSPMNFLTKVLDRPENERPFLLIPVGYPADEVYVPDIGRKRLEEIAEYYN
jgi:iodotyrosine deiodinase